MNRKYSILRNQSALREYAATEALRHILDNDGWEYTNVTHEASLIIATSKQAIASLRGILKEYCKVVLLFFKSQSIDFLDVDPNDISMALIVDDTPLKTLFPWPNMALEIPAPFFKDSPGDNTATGGDNIFINLEEPLLPDNALAKIIRVINRLPGLNISVVCRNPAIAGILNPNVKVLSPSAYMDHLYNSKVVVGAGYTALAALALGKATIIVGERGYGGIPTPDNINLFYNSFFQGTIGGRLDGPIPYNLLEEDISACINGSPLPNVKAALESLCQDTDNRLSAFFKELFNPTGNRFNNDYTIIREDAPPCSHWLLNRYYKNVIARMDNETAAYILNPSSGCLPANPHIQESLISSKIIL